MKKYKFILFNIFILLIIFEISCRNISYISRYCSFNTVNNDRDSTGRFKCDLQQYSKHTSLENDKIFRAFFLKDSATYIKNGGEFKFFPHSQNLLGLYDNTPTDSLEIICIGDSFTQGEGANTNQSWPDVVEQSLGEEVLNGGITGANPYTEKKLLEFLLLEKSLKPKLVLISINRSDISDLETDFIFGKNKNWILQYSVGARFVYKVIKSGDYVLFMGKKNIHKKTIDQMYDVYKKMSQTAKMCNTKICFIFHPTREELENKTWHFNPLIQELQTEDSINVIDLLSIFINEKIITPQIAKKYYWPKDGHNNSLGYSIIGNTISKKIKEMKLI